MESFESIPNRLVRHDYRIAINTARANFARWDDLLIAGTMLLAALAVVRAWFADRPWAIAAWAALGAGIIVGIGAGRLVATRLAFHGFDGVLAADALHPPTCRRYQLVWHGIGMGTLATVTLVTRPAQLIVDLPAYLAGVLIAGLTGGFRVPGLMAGEMRPGWAVRACLHRPGVGVAAAAILLLSLLAAQALGQTALMAVAGVATVLLALPLTIVDDGIVRFMTIAGHGSQRIIAHHGKSMVSFFALAVSGCWLTMGSLAAGIVAAASTAMLFLLTLRVLAYRLYGRRFADFLVSILAGLLMMVAYSMPVALPVVAIAVLWQLQRRGRTKTWLLA